MIFNMYSRWLRLWHSYLAVSLFSAALSALLIFLIVVPRLEPDLHVFYPGNGAMELENVASFSAEPLQSKKSLGLDVININTATVEQLATLYNIGPKRAAAIIEYRTKNPFRTIDEIKDVSGIGDKTFEKIKDAITVGN